MKKNLTARKKSKRKRFTFLKNKKNTILPVIIVFCLPVLLYLQTLSFGFIGFVDTDITAGNIAFLSDFRNAPQAFLTDAFLVKSSHFYRPMLTLSYMADIHLSGGNNVWMYHLTNILLFGLISCLLFGLFRKFLIPLKLALLSTLIYCAHPLFISFTAWIAARADLLLLFFSLLSFLLFIEHLQTKKGIYLFLSWLAFTIALFSKEPAAFLPFVFIIYYFTFSYEKHSGSYWNDINQNRKIYFPTLLLYAVSGISWLWLRSIALKNSSDVNEYGLMPLISNLPMIPDSLARLFSPFDIALISYFSLFKTLAGSGIIILIIVIFFKNRERKTGEKVFGLAWFLLFLLPGMLYKTKDIDYLGHRLILPLIGILLFILFSIPKKWIDTKGTKILWSMIALFALLSSITLVKSRSYSDPITFYNSSISQNPDKALLYTNRGAIKVNMADLQGAISDFTKAIELKPEDAIAYNNRGIAYSSKGNLEKAIRDYEKATELNPDYAGVYNNWGNTYRDKGEVDEAVKKYDKAIELNPNYADAYNNRGNAYQDKGDLAQAIGDYNKAIELNPNFKLAYFNRGNAYNNKGDPDEAVKNYNKAIELDLNYTDAHYNLGRTLIDLGRYDEALASLNQAIRTNPRFADAYYKIGFIYSKLGRLQEEIEAYRQAIRIKPDYADAYYNLGVACGILSRHQDAINSFKQAIRIKPDFADAHFNLGVTYLIIGDRDSAVQEYEILKTLRAEHADRLYNLINK
jgi:tetratricopeptide (TPR) repeat protein